MQRDKNLTAGWCGLFNNLETQPRIMIDPKQKLCISDGETIGFHVGWFSATASAASTCMVAMLWGAPR